MPRIAITIDVEPDFPPELGDCYQGIEEILPKLLDLLQYENLPATIFLLDELCKPFPSLAKEIAERGFHLGNHGLHHILLCLEDERTKGRFLSESTRILESASGGRITAFRAPNFSIDARSLQLLERLGYGLDSSILPGRRMHRHLSGTVYDFRGAPRIPYHPSIDDINRSGSSHVLEVPVTENPLYRQSPIGAGFLNIRGPAETLKAIGMTGLPFNVLVIHHWEFVDLWSRHTRLQSWIKRGCRPNLPALSELIGGLKNQGYDFLDIQSLAQEQADIPIMPVEAQ